MGYLQLKYHVNEVRFGNQIKNFEEQIWNFGRPLDECYAAEFVIESNIQTLTPNSFTLVNNGTHVGIEFQVDEYFDLGAYGYHDKYVRINRIALVRQPHNVWLWMYLLDEEGNNIAAFCGHDDLDGLAFFVDQLKEVYGV